MFLLGIKLIAVPDPGVLRTTVIAPNQITPRKLVAREPWIRMR